MSLAVSALGPGRGPRIALVHGFTQTGRSWLPVAEPLARDGWRVLLPDAPGHGGSSALRADLPAGAHLLGEACGRAVYVGYSMGGRFCLHLALAEPHLVERLVLLGASAGIEDEAQRSARRAADDALAAELERDGVEAFLERWLSGPLFATLPREAAGLADRLRNDAAGLASSLRLAGAGAQADLWPRLPELAMPVTVMAGELDERFTAIGRRLAGAIGANATFTVVPGAGHAAHLERPEELVALLRESLGGLLNQTRLSRDDDREDVDRR
jgi:2-succinyl-6-hydroxy-2,4-cyclohexadiene-1-carboxylate synthase